MLPTLLHTMSLPLNWLKHQHPRLAWPPEPITPHIMASLYCLVSNNVLIPQSTRLNTLPSSPLLSLYLVQVISLYLVLALSFCSCSYQHSLSPHPFLSGPGQMFLTVIPQQLPNLPHTYFQITLHSALVTLLRPFHDSALPSGKEAYLSASFTICPNVLLGHGTRGRGFGANFWQCFSIAKLSGRLPGRRWWGGDGSALIPRPVQAGAS